MTWIIGAGLTAFGRVDGSSTLGLMTAAAEQALDDAGCERRDIDGLLCGYSTTMPHLMLSTVFAEHFGLRPAYAHAVQLGGATGFALVMLAHCLVEAGAGTSYPGRGRRESTDRPVLRYSRFRHCCRLAIPSTKCRSDPPFPRTTRSSRPAICTTTRSRRRSGRVGRADAPACRPAPGRPSAAARFRGRCHGVATDRGTAQAARLLPHLGRRRGHRREPRADQHRSRSG